MEATIAGGGEAWLKIIQGWLPVLTVVVGAGWALYTYLDHQKEAARLLQLQSDKETITRRIEAQKPFLEKQLSLYFETAQIVGKLVTMDPSRVGDWEALTNRFWALYWSELSMVEHGIVEAGMKRFGDALSAYQDRFNKPDRDQKKIELQGAAYQLAHAIRAGIESAWSGNQAQSNRI